MSDWHPPADTSCFLRWLEQWKRDLPVRALGDVIAAAGGAEHVAIVIEDLLVGFAKEGPLSSPRVDALLPATTELLTAAHQQGIQRFLLAEDEHSADALEFRAFGPHCISGTREAETVPEIRALPFFETFDRVSKDCLSIGIGTRLEDWLEEHAEVTHFVIVGDCTDFCVYQAAMHLRLRANANREPHQIIVPANLVDTFDVPLETAAALGILPHPGDLMHPMFLYHMAVNGVQIVSRLTL